MMFQNRQSAGRQLAERMQQWRSPLSPAVVLGLPRGGVVVAAEIARQLDAMLDVLVVRKVGAPSQPELAIGAVTNSSGLNSIVNRELISALQVDEAYLESEIQSEFAEVKRRLEFYRRGRAAVPLQGRTVILVDDGIATGATVRVGIAACRRAKAARVILAVPVAPADTLDALRHEVDELVCLHSPSVFLAVGRFYVDFEQTTDDEVVKILHGDGGNKNFT